MRFLAVMAVAAGLVLGGLLTAASDAQAPARASARAQLGAGSVGDRIVVQSRGNGEDRRLDVVDVPGLDVRSGEVMVRTSVRSGRASARAVAVARSVSVLDGHVTAYGVRRTVTAEDGRTASEGRVSGLKIGDEMIGEVTDERSFELPDGAGRVIVNSGGSGLRVLLTRGSRGFEAGTDVSVAVVSASAVAERPAAPAKKAAPKPAARPSPAATPAPPKQKARPAPRRKKAPPVPARLTGSGFAFPVFSAAATTADDWGGPRQIGPHEGNDIFAPFGAPVLAVADGVVRKVGTLPISGNRLWLHSEAGDRFFYAHLAAFAPAAVSGRRVKAGTVLGFVGNTGDAEPTPPHLHFEVHPGGEGPVDPHEILLAWQQRRDVPPSAWLQRVGADADQRPGALVEVRDFIAGE